MDVDATLLGSAAPLAPGGFGSLTSSSRHVSLSFIPAIVHSSADSSLACSERPLWSQLISHRFTVDNRAPLIAKIFSDSSEVEMVMQLSGDNAQAFIGTITVVSPPVSRPKSKSISFDTNCHTL